MLKALKRALGDHLGDDATEPRFLTALYWRLRESFADLRQAVRGVLNLIMAGILSMAFMGFTGLFSSAR